MKRYTADELRGDLYYTLPDDAVFYSRAELIAAGVLVPVSDGGMTSFPLACEDQCEYVKWNGKICRIDSLQEGVDVVGENRNYPLADAIRVLPVRLVPLEDVG